MNNITLIINTVALWVIVVCQILENRKFKQIRKFNGDLIAKNITLQSKLAVLEHRISSLEKPDLSKKALADLDQVKYELKRIDKTASNNREKIMALQEKNRKQDLFNKDFDRAVKRVGRRK